MTPLVTLNVHEMPANLAEAASETQWARELQRSYTQLSELEAIGLAIPQSDFTLRAVSDRFQIRVTPYYASLIDPRGDLHRDPIFLQAVPAVGEVDLILPKWAQAWSQSIYGRAEPWSSDAIGDVARLAAPRLTHRYGNRALLHVSTLCAVYCRFCFRKGHLNEREESLYSGTLDAAFAYLAEHTEIRELILTGGDPLSLSNTAMAKILERAAAIPHLRVVRIHSRMAVTLPSRLTQGLAEVFAQAGLRVTLVSHFNHPREWTPLAQAGLRRMARAGVTLLNQSVLLAGINDRTEILAELFTTLYEGGVLPYYLHHPDWTPGTFHFRSSVARGQAIMNELRGRVSGPALPDYVLDIPGGHGKASLMGAKVRVLESRRDEAAGMDGAIYEISAPTTQVDSTGKPQRYLDLHSIEI